MSEDNPGVSVSHSEAGGQKAGGSAGGAESVGASHQLSGSLDSRGGTAAEQVGDGLEQTEEGEGAVLDLPDDGGVGKGKKPKRSASNRHKVKFMFRPPDVVHSFEDDGRPTDSEGEIAKGQLERKLGKQGTIDMERRMGLGNKRDLAGSPMHGGSQELGTELSQQLNDGLRDNENLEAGGGRISPQSPQSPTSPPPNLEQMKLAGEAIDGTYNLDSEDDELDFLRKDVNFEQRGKARAIHKEQIRTDLTKNYDRKYPVEHFVTVNQANKKKVKRQMYSITNIFQKAIDERLMLDKEKINAAFKPDSTRAFPTLDKELMERHLACQKKFIKEQQSPKTVNRMGRQELCPYQVSPSVAAVTASAAEQNISVRQAFGAMAIPAPKARDPRLTRNVGQELANVIESKEEFYELMNTRAPPELHMHNLISGTQLAQASANLNEAEAEIQRKQSITVREGSTRRASIQSSKLRAVRPPSKETTELLPMTRDVNKRLRIRDDKGLSIMGGTIELRRPEEDDLQSRLAQMTLDELELRYGTLTAQRKENDYNDYNTTFFKSAFKEHASRLPLQYAYDQAPLGHGGLIDLKRPHYFSPAANSGNNPNTEALTSFKVTPFKLGRAPVGPEDLKNAVQKRPPAADDGGWGSTDPTLYPKTDLLEDLRAYERSGASLTSLHQSEIVNSAGGSGIERQTYAAWAKTFQRQLGEKQRYIEAAQHITDRRGGVDPHQDQKEQLGYIPYRPRKDMKIEGMLGILPISLQKTAEGVHLATGEPDLEHNLAYASPSLDPDAYHRVLVQKERQFQQKTRNAALSGGLNAQSFARRNTQITGTIQNIHSQSGIHLYNASHTAETPQEMHEVLNSETSSLGRRHQSVALATGQQIMMGTIAAEVPQPHVTLQADVLFVNKHSKNLSRERTKLVRKFSKITLNADLPGVLPAIQ